MVIFIVWITLFFFNRKKQLELHKKVYENKDFCIVIMLFEDTTILEFNQYEKSDKAAFVNYADLECIIEKTGGCKTNPENSFTTKASKQEASGFWTSIICLFRSIVMMYTEVKIV